MSFFRSLGRAFGLGGTTRSINAVTNSVVRANQFQANVRNLALQTSFLPQASRMSNRSDSNDAYLFADTQGMRDDLVRQNFASLFREEYGQDLLDPGDSGYENQTTMRNSLLNNKKNELAAGKRQAETSVQNLREARLGNQTGGVRNGIARNPFNMNMIKGPQANAPKKSAPRYIGGGGGMPSDGRQFNLL